MPLSLDEARRIVADYVDHYNNVRLHSAIGYVTPKDRLLGNDAAIHAARDRKLAEARERRKRMRQTRHDQLEARADPDAPPSTSPPSAPPSPSPRSWPCSASRPVRPRRPATRRLPLARLRPGTTRCFCVNTNAHTFHCFKCNRSGNALDLWAAANRLSPYDAAMDLCQRLNIPLPLLATTANREQRRGTRSQPLQHLYNPLSVQRSFFTR